MATVCMGAYRAYVNFHFQTRSGQTYTADANGYIQTLNIADANDLIAVGGVHIPQGMTGPAGVVGTGP